MNVVFESQIDGIRRLKDGSYKITIETQELNDDTALKVIKLKGLVKTLISDTNVTKDIISAVDNMKIVSDSKISLSERMRNVLFRLWESSPEGFEDFNLFYASRMERLINQIKDKI